MSIIPEAIAPTELLQSCYKILMLNLGFCSILIMMLKLSKF